MPCVTVTVLVAFPVIDAQEWLLSISVRPMQLPAVVLTGNQIHQIREVLHRLMLDDSLQRTLRITLIHNITDILEQRGP